MMTMTMMMMKTKCNKERILLVKHLDFKLNTMRVQLFFLPLVDCHIILKERSMKGCEATG